MVACGNRNQFPSATEQTMAHYCVTSTIRMRISTDHVSYKTKTRANNSSPGPAGRPQRQLFVIVGQRLAIRFLQLNLHIREHRHVILRADHRVNNAIYRNTKKRTHFVLHAELALALHRPSIDPRSRLEYPNISFSATSATAVISSSQTHYR